jgi:uncharacterized protein YaiE (UPF0345 family)
VSTTADVGIDGNLMVGTGSSASGINAIAMGKNATASGDYATAIGNNAQAGGNYSVAIGQDASATYLNTFALGKGATASGFGSMALGRSITVASGANYSIGVGLKYSSTPTSITAASTMALVGGKLAVNTTSAGSYHLYVAGQAFTTGTWQGSDRRWKRDISTLDDALTTVRSLRGVRYTWRDDEFSDTELPTGQDIGLIAQEVEEIIPEVVREARDGFKAIAYNKLVGYLIEAIKELASLDEVQDLRDELAVSHAENAVLQERLSSLETRMERMEERQIASR